MMIWNTTSIIGVMSVRGSSRAALRGHFMRSPLAGGLAAKGSTAPRAPGYFFACLYSPTKVMSVKPASTVASSTGIMST